MSSSRDDAQRQLRRLVDEIVSFSKQDCSPDIFFGEFLNRVVAALAAVGGAVWIPGENGGVELQYEVNAREVWIPDNREDAADHRGLVQSVFDKGSAVLIPPRSTGPDQAANSTEYLLLLGPVLVGRETKSVVEILQRPNPSVKTQRGYMRFLQQMCELAADYLKNR